MKRIVLTRPFALVGSSMCLSAAAPTTRPALRGEGKLPPGVVAERDVVHYSRAMRRSNAWSWAGVGTEEGVPTKEAENIAAAAAASETDLP